MTEYLVLQEPPKDVQKKLNQYEMTIITAQFSPDGEHLEVLLKRQEKQK